MATRGQIAYLADSSTIFSLYIHYALDSDLNEVLPKYFNSDSEAEDLVMNGNDIRFIDPDTGEVERYNKYSAKQITNDEPEDLFNELYNYAKGKSAQYVYVWLEDKWITLDMSKGREYFVGTLLDQIRKIEPNMEEGVSENEEDVLGDWISDMLKYKSYDEVVKTLKKALRNALMDDELVAKIKADKEEKELEEIFVHQMKYKAGIIK